MIATTLPFLKDTLVRPALPIEKICLFGRKIRMVQPDSLNVGFSSYGARLVPTLAGRQGEMGQKQREKLSEPLVVLYFCLFSLGAFTPWLRGATSPYTWCPGLAHSGRRWSHDGLRRFHARHKDPFRSIPSPYYIE